MAETLNITCPNCSTSQRVAIDKIPESGAWGRCAVCRHRVFIEPPKTPQAAVDEPAPSTPPVPVEQPPSISVDAWGPKVEAPKAIPSLDTPQERAPVPAAQAYYLKTPTGQTTHSPVKDILDGIRWQKILPWDLVSVDGRNFEPIKKNPEFVEHFQGLPPSIQRNCFNHTDKIAERICARCQRCYCTDCVPPGRGEGKAVHTCWACGGVLQEADPGWRFRPYWRRLREVLLFPTGKYALLATVGLALLLWVASLSIVMAPLYFVVLFFLVHVLTSSAKGKQTLRDALQVRPEPAELPEEAERSLVALALLLVMAAPFIVVNQYLPLFLASVLSFFLGLAAFGYHPMAMGVAVLSEKPLAAFKIRVVLKQIQAMGEDYLILLLGLLLMEALLFVSHFVLGGLPLFGALVTKVIWAYSLLVMAHMVGWTFYLNFRRLGWRRELILLAQ